MGNLPPGCVALIKITYVSELQVEGELINFSIPGSVAPWKQEANNTEVRYRQYTYIVGRYKIYLYKL